MNKFSLKRILRSSLLFFPSIISFLFSPWPGVSYFISWFGSFFILFWTISGNAVALPEDLPASQQFFRPVFLSQIVFVSFNVLSSIFFFLDSSGFYYFKPGNPVMNYDSVLLQIAQCQRYYLLGHAAVAFGIVLHMKYDLHPKWIIRVKNYSTLFFYIAVTTFLASLIVAKIYVLAELSSRLRVLALVSSVLSFTFNLSEKNKLLLLGNTVILLGNFYLSIISAWKAESITLLLLLFVPLYAKFKKLAITLFLVGVTLWFLFIPYYTQMFRTKYWAEEASTEEALIHAYTETKFSSFDSLAVNNWFFLVNRLSEIGLFIKYVGYTPSIRGDYYGLQIVSQSLHALLPRAIDRYKPDLEELVMERVYENDVVGRPTKHARVSAKPQFIVDGYLTAGWLGILIACYIYGALASILSRTCERYFSGYIFGTALIFNSLFQVFWRGQCFEFLTGKLVWSIAMLFLVFIIGRFTGLLKRNNQPDLMQPTLE
ncbi:MAG: hypothetical protein NTW13_02495 [Candidatus Omnitrophica bacterium]|nr:hypothetical protein [Candidatus Omnitrophota bacterium]